MNPSSQGWIPKFFQIMVERNNYDLQWEPLPFYEALKRSGFIYGLSVKTIPEKPLSALSLTQEETTKINLLHALVHTHYLCNIELNSKEAVTTITEFYRNMGLEKKRWLVSGKKESVLENILSGRVQEKNIFLKAQSVSILTYAALFSDVLAYSFYLQAPQKIAIYTEKLSKLLLGSCRNALLSKQRKGKYDHLLLEMIEDSSSKISTKNNLEEEIRDFFSVFDHNEALVKNYLLDISTLATWDDGKIDTSEEKYLKNFCAILQLPPEMATKSIADITYFSLKHAKQIHLFEYSHPVKQFYKQSSATVQLLIVRNKKRLIKELAESGELLLLLGHSTVRELSKEEKKKVREQLLDICKTIPSLTIFLLPGGSVLLPLLIKFIPKLLPSAFNENRIEKN